MSNDILEQRTRIPKQCCQQV